MGLEWGKIRMFLRPWRRWKDDVRTNFKVIGVNAKNWVDSAQDRDYWRALVIAALNLRIP